MSTYTVKSGDKIVQIIFKQIILPTIEFSFNLDTTARAKNGFGSTNQQHDPPLPNSTNTRTKKYTEVTANCNITSTLYNPIRSSYWKVCCKR